MKKVLIILLLVLTMVGCQNINASKPLDLINYVLSNPKKMVNEYRTGYKYYMPTGLKVDNSKEYNEKLSSNNTNYYLFVDLISYYNKTPFTYEKNPNAYLSSEIKYKNNSGYIEIKEDRNNFYVEMMYNYAKIELVTSEYNLKEDIYRAITVLSSLKYNDAIVKNIMGDNVLYFKETTYNVFKPKENVEDFLDFVDEYNTYDGDDTSIPDYDIIN